ncbi:retrovirus-related pol polyprotein from transposon TNT 1-94 [Tanacetum coccineum]
MVNFLEDIQCADSDTHPPMLDRTDFASWQQRIRLYCREGNKGALHLGLERPCVYSDLSPEDKDRYNANIQVTNILLQEFLKDFYSLINHYTDAKDIWDNVKMLLEGSEFTKEDHKSQRTSSNPRNQAIVQDSRVVVLYVQGRQNRGQGNNARGVSTASYGGAQNRVRNANPGGQDNIVDEDVDKQPVQDLAINVDNVFQADDCDAFDYDVDEAPTTQTMFMSNLSSTDPVYDEVGPSYDSDILSEVYDYDLYQDVVCEHHEQHEMHDDVQPNYVVDLHVNYTSDSNMIMYDQYVKDNAVPAVQSNVSSVPNDAYMMIYNDMYEPQSVSKTTRNIVVDNSLTAELVTYKEQVELYERRVSLKVQIQNKLSCVNKDHVKPKVLAPGKYDIDVEPIPHHNRNNREVHLIYLKHLKESVETLCEIELLEYVIGTCPKDLNTQDNKHASTPLPKKKQVTFDEQCAMLKSNTHKPIEKLNCQKTNVPVPPSIGVNSCTDASRSQPRRNTKKNRILLAKSVNMKKVKEHPRTIKSSLKTMNRVDSSISYLFALYECIPPTKNVMRKVTQVWKPKQVKQVWKPTSNILTTVGCSKHMTGDRSRLRNFVKKFIRTVRFRNDHFSAIMGYGDYVIGESVISKNDIVERQNRTLIKAARTMLIFSKALMFLWAEAVATAVFGALCYLINDSEDLGKLQPTADIGIFISYAPSRKGYRIYNKRTRRIMETIHMQFDELIEHMAPVQLSTGPAPSFLTPGQIIVSVPVNSAGIPSSTTINQDAPSPSHSPSSSVLQSASLHKGIAPDSTLMEDNPFTLVDNHPFINVFALEPSSEASSSEDLIKPKNFKSAITEDCWFQAMQDEIQEFDRLQYGDVLKNKAKLVAKGYQQEEGIDFKESWLHVSRLFISSSPMPPVFVHNIHLNLDTMADVNVNAPVGQAPAMEPPTPFERPRALVLQILWGIINRAHIDYAERMLEEFTQSIHSFVKYKKNLAQHTQFSAKGTKLEVFGMPIPNDLITNDNRGEQYYIEYLEKVAKNQRYLVGEEVCDPDSPAPKPAKATKPKATKQSKPQPSKPTPATTESSKKDQSKKPKLVQKSSEAPSLAKRPKADKELVYGDEEADTQREIEESLKEVYDAHRGPLPLVVIREPNSRKFQPLPDVQGNGKEKVSDEQVALDLLTLQTPKKKSPAKQYIFQRRSFAPTEPSGHDESSSLYAELDLIDSETESDEEVPGIDDGDQDEVSQSQSSHVVHAGPNREHMDFEVTDTSIQQNPEQTDEEFTTTTYPNVQENLKRLNKYQVRLEEPASSARTLSSLQNLDKELSFANQFLVEKSQEDKPEKTNTESEVQSMVTVPIHQDTSYVPLMTTQVIDLTVS